MKTVLHIASVFPSGSNRIDLQFQFACDQWNIELIHLKAESPYYGDLPPGCLRIRTLPNWPPRSEKDSLIPRKIKSAIRRLIRSLTVITWLIRSKADIMHAHENSALWHIFFWASVLGKPAVWDPHDYFHKKSTKGIYDTYWRKKILEKRLIARGVPVIAVSKGMGRKYSEMYPTAKVHIIKNYSSKRYVTTSSADIEVELADLIKLRHEEGTEKIRIVHPGLLKANRVEPNLILKIGSLKNVQLDLYGYDRAGRYEQEIENLMARERLTNIRLMGKYSPDNIIRILREYHFAIFPFPVLHENISFCLPNKFFQCIEAGLPMLITDMEELNEIIGNHWMGYSFPSQDYDALGAILENFDIESKQYEDLVKNVLLYRHKHIDYGQQQDSLLQLYASVTPNMHSPTTAYAGEHGQNKSETGWK